MPKELEDLVDKLKNKPNVDNPYALAHYILNQKGGKLTTAKIDGYITQYNTMQTETKIASMRTGSLKTAFDESEHPRVESGENAGQFTCKECGKGHESKNELSDHMHEEHGQPSRHEPDFHKTFPSKKVLTHDAKILDKTEAAQKWKSMSKDERVKLLQKHRPLISDRYANLLADQHYSYVQKTIGHSMNFRNELSSKKDETSNKEKDGNSHIAWFNGLSPDRKVNILNTLGGRGTISRHDLARNVVKFKDLPDDLKEGVKMIHGHFSTNKKTGSLESRLLSSKLETVMLSVSMIPKKASAISDGLDKTKDRQHTCSTCGDIEDDLKFAKLVTGSLVEEHTNDDGKYVSYFLLRGDHVNLKKWGVTEESIPHRIASFKGMPFVITAKKFFPSSPYGEVYDHPSTEHFPKLGIAKVGSYNPNDMMLQAEFQEHFRVGSIVDVSKKDKDWIAVIKIKPEFAKFQMPPLVSPAIFKLNRSEPDGQISTWTGMHIAGLDEKPAYGVMAVYHGSCDGPGQQCIKQLTAKMTGHRMIIPSAERSQMLHAMEIKIASMRTDILSASMASDDHKNIQVQNINKKKSMNFSEMQSMNQN